MEKPRMKYTEWKRGYEEGTVAWVIERVVKDIAANELSMKQLGRTQSGVMKAYQARAIGKKMAAALTQQDVVEDLKERRKTVGASTANADIGYLDGALKHYASTWRDLDLKLALVELSLAKRFCRKHRLIGHSIARKRRPTDAEVTMLLEKAQKRDAHPKAKIRLADCFAFALASARRRGEIVRITHGDVDYEKSIYWVRDVKHPTKKKGNDKCFILFPEMVEIIKRQPRVDPNDPSERIFPFNGNSLGVAFVNLKKECGIEGLRFHDCRRDCISRWLLRLPPSDVRLMVSGHDTIAILEKNYDGRGALEVAMEKLPEFRQQHEKQIARSQGYADTRASDSVTAA